MTDYQIGTQEEIVEHLKEAGITATQATVSRDIKELGIVKIPLRDNTYVYELPKSIVKSLQLAEDNIESAELMDKMINLQATQATVSRDIKELGIVKIPLRDNTYVYELPKSIVKSLQLAEDNIESAELMDKMINLQVIPGNTAFVKAQLIDTFADKIFSCLTDDSSILVIARSGSLAEEIFEQVKNW
ncbi:transcriptional repressor protein [Streptococcus pneumoniae]|nr:transcriptional repressor protein [Streptococcus pneumoniae]VTJ09915.1 transcriptional repressor protein [Streptococcus pneumoniae]